MTFLGCRINQTYQGIQVSSVYQMGVYLVRHFYEAEGDEAKIGSMAGILVRDACRAGQ